MGESAKIFEVYLHRCRVNGKGYVGITSRGVRQRLYSHESEARHGSNRPFARAIRKHGIDTFETSVLASGLTEQQALAEEQRFIRELGTFGSGGYNATIGGEGTLGARLTDERRKEISEHFRSLPRTERHRKRCSDALKGRVLKPEHIEKMAAARRGIKQSPEMAERSRDNLAKAKSVWSGMRHSGESKRRMRAAKATLIAIVHPDGRSIVERTTYRDLAEKFTISHSALSAAAILGRMITKDGPLKGCYIWNLSKPTPTNLVVGISKIERYRNAWAA